jgi:predicted RNase H-like HicB family nuclease
MVNWAVEEEIDLDTGKIIEKPRRVVKVRDSKTEGMDSVTIKKLKGRVETLELALANADNRIAQYLERIYHLENDPQPIQSDEIMSIKKSVLLQNLEQMKVYFRVQGARPSQDLAYRTMKENIENL